MRVVCVLSAALTIAAESIDSITFCSFLAATEAHKVLPWLRTELTMTGGKGNKHEQILCESERATENSVDRLGCFETHSNRTIGVKVNRGATEL